MHNNIHIIIGREFSERVAKKSFIVTTLLMPLLMLAMMAAPTLIAKYSTPTHRTIAVCDRSGIVAPTLAADRTMPDYITIAPSDLPPERLTADEAYDGVLVVGAGIVDNPSDAQLFTRDAGSITVEEKIQSAIRNAVERERLKRYDIENLDAIMKEVSADVRLKTIRLDESGGQKDTSSALSFVVGMVMTFTLYMFLLMYGQMVMTSIIEEKNNRVLELVVSSVRPLHLMMGKIIGVGLVALVQVAVWGVLLCCMSAFLLPALMPEGLSQEVAMAGAGTLDEATAQFDPELIQVVGKLGSVSYIGGLFLMMTLFLIGGFLFYAAIFAAIGSAVDNIQDASQLQTFAIVPIIVALVCSLSIASDPNSPVAFWLSMVPFTSPMVMLARIPFDIAPWQVWTSLLLLYASFVAMAWVAAKIYRVGIFMYGKKPTVKDLVKWMKYK